MVDASGLSLGTMGSAEYMTDSDPMAISVGRNNYIDFNRDVIGKGLVFPDGNVWSKA